MHVPYANVTSKRMQYDELCRAMSGRTLATCNVKDVLVRAVLGGKLRHNSTGACDAQNLLPCMWCIGCFRAHALRCFSKLNWSALSKDSKFFSHWIDSFLHLHFFEKPRSWCVVCLHVWADFFNLIFEVVLVPSVCLQSISRTCVALSRKSHRLRTW